jgi:hypothetical protein
VLPDVFKRLKPLYGKRIDDLWIAYQLGSPEDKLAIDEVLTILAVKRLGIAVGDEKIILEPPPYAVITTGEYTIGTITYPGLAPYPFTVHRKDLLRHMFLLGPSGTGKSTLIIGLLRQLLRDGVPFWSIDFKRNYRCLLNDPNGGDLLILTVGRDTAPLLLNMLRPPRNVAPEEWVEALADTISSAYLLMQGARNVLKEALLSAISYKGERATMRDALDYLRQQLVNTRSGGRRYGWLESSYRSVEELTKGALGKSLNAIDGTTLEALLEIPAVFELQGLGDDQKRCFCVYLLQGVLLLRKHQTDAREVLRNCLIFDEAQNVYQKDQWGHLSLPSKLAREIREFGTSIISATQQTDVADSLIANSGIKLILRTDYPKDADFASKLLQIDVRWLAKIPLGQGIARLPTRYYQPFLFSFAEQPLKNLLVPDALVHERYTQSRLSDSVTAPAGPVIAPAAVSGGLSARQAMLLQDISNYPVSTVTERYARLSWNPKTGTLVTGSVLDAGLARFEAVKTLAAQLKILTLTEAGATQIGVTLSRRRGGAVHEYWREQCRRWLIRHKYVVTDEYPVGGGRSVDLHGANNGETIIIEIETGKSDVDATILKLVGLAGRRVVFIINEETRHHVAAAPGIEVWTPVDLQR